MSLLKANKRVSVPELSFKRSTVTRFNGVVAPRVVSAVFDPSANTAQRPIGAYGLGVYLPDNAVVTKAWIDVVTTFTSAGADAGTIAVHAQTANDIVSAIAISDASNVWDAGIRGTKVGSYATSGNAETALVQAASLAASMLKLTAEREVTVTVATQALTAGKAVIYIEYVLGE
jgi:hypothetical protein